MFKGSNLDNCQSFKYFMTQATYKYKEIADLLFNSGMAMSTGWNPNLRDVCKRR